jgi:uncharacterized surface protein with fasciclin (FAS1) repeats
MKRVLAGFSMMALATALSACGGDDDADVDMRDDDVVVSRDAQPPMMDDDDDMAMDVDTADEPVVDETIVDVAAGNSDFSTLVSLVQLAGLQDDLAGDGPFTVFAPNNAAFQKLPAETVDMLRMPQNREQLAALLQYHVVDGETMSSDLSGEMTVSTLSGDELRIDAANTPATVNEAVVLTTDILASNGVIHVIDTVLLPPVGGE